MTGGIVLDAGALIALDRNDRQMWAVLRIMADEGRPVYVPAGVIAQAWRDGARQALLSRALRHCDEVPLDGVVARAAGLLCGHARTADVIDASVVLTASTLAPSEETPIFTSDPTDIAHLADTLGARIRIELI